jgi:hypothetical protein
MDYVLSVLIGAVVGGVAVLLFNLQLLSKVKAREKAADMRSRSATEAKGEALTRQAELEQHAKDREAKVREYEARIREREAHLRELEAQLNAASADRDRKFFASTEARNREMQIQADDVNRRQAEFEARLVSYRELRQENSLLKRDLQNLDVTMRKLDLDGELRQQRQVEIDGRSQQLAKRYLTETVKAVVAAVGPSNFSGCKTRLVDTIRRVREIGFEVPAVEEAKLLTDLKAEFEREVRAEFERQEQSRIKAQIREEEKLRREVERELKQLERERLAVQAALDQALAEAKGAFSAEVESLKARLTEAEEKSKRAMSMAQQTKAGHVYVISNIGTLGTGVFKIGMTRRLVPKERIDELGSASVPFPFDVHMMISCENAPALENALHKALHRRRVNKANPRKEFFRSDIQEICEIVKAHHGEVQFVSDPEAAEYRQTLTMSDEDAAFIEEVYESAADESEGATEEV